jgi:hypothetical protein
MKKILFTPLLTMLIVSCRTITTSSELSLSSNISSQSESSIASQTTSSSSIVSSSTITTTNSSTISSEPVNTRKVPFNQIGSLVAQVVDAKAIGIFNSKDRTQLNGRRNAEGEDQNYMVKITETYTPNTEITEDQTVQVVFTRVTETTTTELQTGTESYVATAKSLTIERLTEFPGNIVITNTEGYEYRLLSEKIVVQDWISSELDTIQFIFDETLTGITIESRSLNASISFIAYEGFTYAIKQGETVIYEDLLDNDEPDTNKVLGNITLFGLTEGLTYDINYEGYQVIETISQDEVEGQVDKLYVLYQYTFISFVPLNLNQRPQDQDLELDYDGVPLYDKEGYYSDATRQSFVVNNSTGLIYKIENINIASLSGGCVIAQDSPFPFDLRITLNNQLEFFQLHSNSDITFSNSTNKPEICIKDKWGNKFIKNPRIDYFDEVTKTTYYKFNYDSLNLSNYYLNSIGEIVASSRESSGTDFWQYKIVDSNGQLRDFNQADSFEMDLIVNLGIDHKLLKVEKGIMYFISDRQSIEQKWYNNFSIVKIEPALNTLYSLGFSNMFFNQEFANYQLLLVFDQNTSEIKLINDFWSIFETISLTDFMFVSQTPSFTSYFSIFEGIIPESIEYKSLLSQIDQSNLLNNIISKFSLDGTIYYDLILEFLDSSWTVNSYISGTYVAPPSTSITLQPINN